jgi:SAM-dependent methyltransferase
MSDGVLLMPVRIISINPEPTAAVPSEPGPPTRASAEDIPVDEASTPSSTLPPQAAPKSDGERRSDPGEGEIAAEDLVTLDATPSPPIVVASLPPMRPRLTSNPTAPPLSKKPLPVPLRSKPPLVIVPPHMGSLAPQPPEGSGLRRKGRSWWEELFNDDYLRAAERITDEQLVREVDFIEDSLGIERGGAMLDLACGTGRHAVELARRGYELVGFDLSLAMLARASDEAQERSAKLNFLQGDMREMTFREQFDGVYCWNTSFGYFEEDKNALVADRIHGALKSGGLLLLDVVNRDFVVQQSPSLAWFEGDGCVCMDEMSVDFITSRMRVKRTMMLDDGRSREIEYSTRLYSLHELGKMLHDHGFKVCEVTGRIATPGVFFGHESPRTIILAEKR